MAQVLLILSVDVLVSGLVSLQLILRLVVVRLGGLDLALETNDLGLRLFDLSLVPTSFGALRSRQTEITSKVRCGHLIPGPFQLAAGRLDPHLEVLDLTQVVLAHIVVLVADFSEKSVAIVLGHFTPICVKDL